MTSLRYNSATALFRYRNHPTAASTRTFSSVRVAARSVHVHDFRSDTVTRPTAAMFDIMASASTGDDVMGVSLKTGLVAHEMLVVLSYDPEPVIPIFYAIPNDPRHTNILCDTDSLCQTEPNSNSPSDLSYTCLNILQSHLEPIGRQIHAGFRNLDCRFDRPRGCHVWCEWNHDESTGPTLLATRSLTECPSGWTKVTSFQTAVSI